MADSRFSLYSHRGDMASANASFLLLEGGHTDLMLDGEGGASAEFIDAVHGFYTGCITAAPLG